MNVCYYKGNRVYFRPIEPGDEPLLRQWFNDPRNWRYLNRYLPINELREREFIEKLYTSPADVICGVALCESHQLVGVVGLHRIDVSARCAILGITLGPEEIKDKGLGTETMRLMLRYAFRELNLNRVELTVMSSNARAIHVYEKIGFVWEGRSRQAFWRDGRYHDELHYSVLREEYDRVSEGVGKCVSEGDRQFAGLCVHDSRTPAILCRDDALLSV
ncbi:MAG: GNAT family N-acetyltransferase [Phycisphaerales bacterium]|nr:GNAT family N-acetyltransferase [Phycisphaerales bacterium]